MEKLNDLLEQYLSEQVALEEHLHTLIGHQLSDVDEVNFADAKELLVKTKQVLAQHFDRLNALLDKAREREGSKKWPVSGVREFNGHGKEASGNPLMSRILCDNYSALNFIAMRNTLLHTTALAVDSQEVAAVALKHLENLAPLVASISELMPHIVTRELTSHSNKIDPVIGQVALENMKRAWRNS